MEQIAYYGHDTGENILWNSQDNALYWLDIPAGKVFRGHFSGVTGEVDHGCEQPEHFESACILQMDEPIGGFVFRTAAGAGKSGFLLFATEGRIYEWDYSYDSEMQSSPELYCQVEAGLVPSRFNDVLALPVSSGVPLNRGAFVLCGTMPSDGNADSRLLLFDVAQRSVVVVQENLKLANGMGLSPQRDFLYFADTRDFVVYRFAVQNIERGEIDWSSREKRIDFTGRPGRPDGLCVDQEGRIWLAETGAGLVSCFGTDGRELGRLEVGTPKITSCCFGGNKKNILFVSTQGGQDGPKDLSKNASGDVQDAQKKAGGIFALAPEAVNGEHLSRKIGMYFRGQEEAFVDTAAFRR
ncbi:SMP-30/gluconolactonase/LRE family protein [Candidatus Haliotispira prima]|uniref:SMP-30/gluconolactonase/LRE family protein n=1 Tax=Candidatus Haliotispira prima TaxID=3034016 RepID=A0ABY8MM40_9SPIO|nr:SMP-30/gluconolactonase/LRE family protein [Candidatus Haliotispira prima]